jgi:hypothetical protein
MAEQRALFGFDSSTPATSISSAASSHIRRSTLSLPNDVRWTDGGIWDDPSLPVEQREYRYALSWGPDEGPPTEPMPVFIGMNPSGASGERSDKTMRWGWQATRGFTMTNLCGFRCTWPWDLLLKEDPVGPRNNEELRERIREARWVCVCWGGPARVPKEAELDPEIRREKTARLVALHASRVRFVHELLLQLQVSDVRCLGLTGTGYPRHPSRLGYDVPLVPYRGHLDQRGPS